MDLETISLTRLSLAFVPVFFVIVIMWHWRLDAGKALWAVTRMLVQLLLIGYVLVYIFQAQSSGVVLAVVAVMV